MPTAFHFPSILLTFTLFYPAHSHCTTSHRTVKVNDERREVIGGESAPTEDGDGEGDAGDLKR